MDLTLWRQEFRDDGIFGHLMETGKGNFIAVTLEHSYKKLSKIPPGEYLCKRGTGLGEGEFKGFHKLHDNVWFDTFEVMNVPGHTNILFHQGNYNKDSDGCILLGGGIGFMNSGGQMITSSKLAFAGFMTMQKYCNEFKLIVESTYSQP